MIQSIIGTSFTGGYPQGPLFRLMFTDISFANTIVGDASNVNDWNIYLDLPTLGTPFTSVNISGNEVILRGGAGITLKTLALAVIGKEDPSYLISVNDEGGMITELQESVFYKQALLTTVFLPQVVNIGGSCFSACTSLITLSLPQVVNIDGSDFAFCYSLTNISLPQLTTAGMACFIGCNSLTNISLPLCTDLGVTVGNNDVFSNIIGNTISLTIPASLMTCNSGNPDGDIQYLQANNTVTITQV